MMNTNTMATRIEELLGTGKTLQEALDIVMKESQVAQPKIVDRVTWISSLGNITELRTATKIAFAKKSKSKGNPEAIARYEKEIKAGQARLNELLAQVDGDYKKALELGESIEGAAHLFLQEVKSKVDNKIEHIQGITKAEIKRQVQKMDIEFPKNTPEDIQKILEDRAKRGDMLVITTLKRIAWLRARKNESKVDSTN